MPKKAKTFKEKTVEFEADGKGGVIATHKGKTEAAILGDIDLSDLGIAVNEGTIIATHRNPTCFWYFYGGKWYVYCC
ncbi:hypothetical protein NBG4_80010 [Candidatus Sulfobium mesophilum]|uniref:Uncharacterized protein n=1 Tax=Candidatus Sulfobium mesophilum TaxID=2016548 RepID=A0A2U3QKP4_9BACT|nr:hypothetical protein NBG4_80010 [Candidatus Sulfobium mesophilum]